MFRRSLILVCMLTVISSTFAATTYCQWTGSAGDGLWTTAGNWNPATVPNATDLGGVTGNPNYKAGFKTGGSYPAFSSGVLTTDILVTGGGTLASPGGFTISGATMNVSEYITLGAAATDYGLLTINSGNVSTGVQKSNQPFYVTQLGTGTLTMNGGNLYVGNYQTPATALFTGNLMMSGTTGTTGSGTINLLGGTIYATDLLPGVSATARSLVVKDGQLILKTDRRTELAGYSWISAYAGYQLHTTYDSASNTTTLSATLIPEPATISLLCLGVFGLLRRKK